MSILPPEIWLQILEIATVVPSELNENAVSIFERSTHLEAQQARERNLPTRRALPLVCRAWYALATRFLYKSITLRRGKNARKLLESLGEGRSGATDQTDESTCRGRWTKRLDVDTKRPHHWDKTAHGELLHLLPLMPNLTVLVYLGVLDLPDDRILMMGLQSCHNLKMIYLPPNMLPKYENAIFQILTTPPLASSLRIFYPSHPGVPSDPTRRVAAYSDNKQCRNLRALTSSDAWIREHAAQDSSYFPHLCTLHIFGEIYEPFLVTHGFKVTTLDLEVSRWESVILTLRHFPNLRNIILDIVSVIDLARIYEYASNASLSDYVKTERVKLVGMTVNSTQARHVHYSWVFRLLPVIFPKLEQVRILERKIVHSLCKQPGRVLRWHSEFMEKRVRLEREDGELLIKDCPSI